MSPGARSFLLLFATFAVFGQQSDQSKGRVQGKVLNGLTGEPLRKVQLVLSGSQSRSFGRPPGGPGAMTGPAATVFTGEWPLEED